MVTNQNIFMHNDQTVRPLLGFRVSKMKLDFDYGVYSGVETIFSCVSRKISLQSYMGNYVAVESDGTVTQSAVKDRRTIFSVYLGRRNVPNISLKSHLHADWLTVRYPVIHQLQTQLTTIQLLFMLSMKLVFLGSVKKVLRKLHHVD